MRASPIKKLEQRELAQLVALLQSNHLPGDDCADQAECFFGLFEDDLLIAAGGLEPAGDCALLRSVVVHPDYRARGLGRQITNFLLARARAGQAAAVYLLTESAEHYFTRLGFSRTARDAVPPAIAATRQFAALCPDSASCMVLQLPRP